MPNYDKSMIATPQAQSIQELKGLSIPISFSTGNMKATSRSGPDRFAKGYMEIYFSNEPVDSKEVNQGKSWTKEFALYLRRTAYGPHQFLVPAKSENMEPYEAIGGLRVGIGKINEDPTTAVKSASLQLTPCRAPNLDYFLGKLQTHPFYIEVTDAGFILHVRDESGQYLQILGHDYSPPCWHGYGHPVMTLWYSKQRFPTLQAQPLYEFADVPWTHLASCLGSLPSVAPPETGLLL